MQKLLIIELKAMADRMDGQVREFISDYLEGGWQIASVTATGAGQDSYRSFLLAVVVEREDNNEEPEQAQDLDLSPLVWDSSR